MVRCGREKGLLLGDLEEGTSAFFPLRIARRKNLQFGLTLAAVGHRGGLSPKNKKGGEKGRAASFTTCKGPSVYHPDRESQKKKTSKMRTR